MSSNNKNEKQVQLLQTKIRTWVNHIGNSRLPPYHKRLSLEVRFLAQMAYPMEVVSLSVKDLESTFRPLLRVVKSLFSLPLSFPTSLLHLNRKFGGYGMVDLPILGIAERNEYYFQVYIKILPG